MAIRDEVFDASTMAAEKRASGSESETAIPVNDVPYAAAKRCLDILLSLIGIIIAAPLFALSALLVRLSSPGPVIIRQTRAGCGERTFTLYKFCTMYSDAEARTSSLMHGNEGEISELFGRPFRW